jgi:hypothetical protein
MGSSVASIPIMLREQREMERHEIDIKFESWRESPGFYAVAGRHVTQIISYPHRILDPMPAIRMPSLGTVVINRVELKLRVKSQEPRAKRQRMSLGNTIT